MKISAARLHGQTNLDDLAERTYTRLSVRFVAGTAWRCWRIRFSVTAMRKCNRVARSRSGGLGALI